MKQELTPSQQTRYLALLGVIRQNLASGQKLWAAMKQIKEEKLYLFEHETWQAFCNAELQYTPQWANKLIAAYEGEIRVEIESKTGTPEKPPDSDETQAGGSESETKFQFSPPKNDAKTDQKSTPKPAEKPTPEPEPERDKTGWPIPMDLLPLWGRRGELSAAANLVSNVKRAIEKGLADEDPIWRGIRNGIVLEAQSLYSAIKLAMPHAVCPKCQGKIPKTCDTCKGLGLVTEYFWNQCVPKEDKLMRAKKLEAKA